MIPHKESARSLPLDYNRRTESNNKMQLAADELRERIRGSLREQGFRVRHGLICPPDPQNKDGLRHLHAAAVQHAIQRSEPGLRQFQRDFLTRIASGNEVVPERVSPALVRVEPDSLDELLFRFVRLHWTIPVSPGYGRRMRFLVIDQSNQKLIGVIGLGDPVFNLAVRDRWIGWDGNARRDRLRNVMDAYILGSVPPYSCLLGSKLVAMLTASDEVRQEFAHKYAIRRSVIRRKLPDPRLALITTMSALGRSSVYNRLRLKDRLLFESLGFSEGSGEFHFSNGIYASILAFAAENCEPTAKKSRWGTGFRNRREVIRKCLAELGLPEALLYHGIRREVFAVPLARNTREFLRGQHVRLRWYKQSASDLFMWFRERWLLPRALRDARYRSFQRRDYALWPESL
jgi:hypothetical protein